MGNEVKVVVTGDYRGGAAFAALDRDVAKAEKSTASFADRGVDRASRSLDTFRATAATGGTVLAGLVGAGLAVQKVMGDGITVALTEANAQVSLGEKGFASLSAAADENANRMGFTRTEFLGTAGAAASLAKNLGFSQEASAKLGAAFPDLADKLAVLSNGKVTTAEAADQLRSAMAGEFDPLQSLGIAINAAAVETEALKIQQQSQTEITKEQATSMAVLAIVQRQTADASKVMATEAGRAAAEAQQSQAELKEAYEDLSRAAVPVLKEVTAATAAYVESWTQLGDSSVGAGDKIIGLAKNLVPLTHLVDAVTSKTEEQGDASKETALDVMGLAEGAQGAAKSEEDLAKETSEATDAIREQAGIALDAREAQRQWQEAIDAARDSLKENGRTLDTTTEKGRANEAALDDMAEAAFDVADAVVAAGGSEKDYRSSLQQSRASLVRQAQTFGMTKREAERYADQVLAIPRARSTKITLSTRQALGQLANLGGRIRALDGSYIRIYARTVLNDSAVRGLASGGPSTAAAGGGRNGMTLVGENGPELVPLQFGSMVHDAATSRQMMRRGVGAGGGGGGAGAPIVVELTLDGQLLARRLVDPMRSTIRSLGGNVQTALGDTRGAA